MIPALNRRFLPKVLLLYACALLLGLLAGALLTKTSLAHRFDPYVAIGVALAALVGIAILLEWRLGVFLLGAALPFEGLLTSGPFASGIKALGLLTFSSIGFRLLWDRELNAKLRHLLRHPLVKTLLVFVLWCTVSVLWAVDQGVALTKAVTVLGLLGLVLAIGLLKERELTSLWGLVGLSVAASVPLAYVLPQSKTVVETGRLGSPGQHPNDFAGLLVIAFLVTYWMLNKRFPVARYVLAVPMFFGVLATQSRTGLVVLLATPLLTLLMPGASKRSMRLILIVYGFAALVFMGVVYTVPTVGETFIGRYETLSQYQSEDTWAGRWDLWNAAFHIIFSHPLLGVGVGNFPEVAPIYSSVAAQLNLMRGLGAATTHDAFLSVTSELGLIGLALFVGILFLAFRQTLAFVRHGSAAATGLLFGLVAYIAMILTTSWEYQKIGYFVLGSILALHAPRVLQNATQKVRKWEENQKCRL